MVVLAEHHPSPGVLQHSLHQVVQVDEHTGQIMSAADPEAATPRFLPVELALAQEVQQPLVALAERTPRVLEWLQPMAATEVRDLLVVQPSPTVAVAVAAAGALLAEPVDLAVAETEATTSQAQQVRQTLVAAVVVVALLVLMVELVAAEL